MTPKNQQLLMIMSWARSFHALLLEDCESIANEVLNEFGGNLDDNASPAAVMSSFDRIYFTRCSNEPMLTGDSTTPAWEDYGLVRPPELQTPRQGYISDNTTIDAYAIAHAQLTADPDFIFNYGTTPDGTGVRPDTGELVLNSGGVVPVLSPEQRAVVWPLIFSNPVGYDQEKIDELIGNIPEEFIPETHVEKQAIFLYKNVTQEAEKIEASIRLEYDNNPTHSH